MDVLEVKLPEKRKREAVQDTANPVADARAAGFEPGSLKRRRVDVKEVDTGALRALQSVDPSNRAHNKCRIAAMRSLLLGAGHDDYTLRRVNKALEQLDATGSAETVFYAPACSAFTTSTDVELIDKTPFCTAVFPPSL